MYPTSPPFCNCIFCKLKTCLIYHGNDIKLFYTVLWEWWYQMYLEVSLESMERLHQRILQTVHESMQHRPTVIRPQPLYPHQVAELNAYGGLGGFEANQQGSAPTFGYGNTYDRRRDNETWPRAGDYNFDLTAGYTTGSTLPPQAANATETLYNNLYRTDPPQYSASQRIRDTYSSMLSGARSSANRARRSSSNLRGVRKNKRCANTDCHCHRQ